MQDRQRLHVRREALTELAAVQLGSVRGGTGEVCETIRTTTKTAISATVVASALSRCITCRSCDSCTVCPGESDVGC